MEVYDLIGEKVAALVDGKQKVGYKVARGDASLFSGGIHFYSIQAGDCAKTRKMMLLNSLVFPSPRTYKGGREWSPSFYKFPGLPEGGNLVGFLSNIPAKKSFDKTKEIL